MHIRRAQLIFILAVLLVVGCLGAAQPMHAANTKTTQPEIVVEIAIPGVTFDCANQAGKMCVRSMGEYISGFYRFFAGALAVIAAVMVMWGGIKWTTAGGNASRVKDAKDTIFSAIIALVITFGSYVLLYTINPQIVKLELPNINSIVGIQQGGGGCSDYSLDSINLGSGCNPKTTECCGKTMTVNLGGGKTDTCEWDVCNALNDVCVRNSDPAGKFIKGTPKCVTVEELCLETDGGDKRNWCPTVDSVMRQTKIMTEDKTQFKSKYLNTGCGFLNRNNVSDQCLWNVTLSKFFELFPSGGIAGFQKKFISCYTQGAKDVCWGEVAGRPQALNCGENQSTPCADPNTVPRPVAGASGGCLVKDGADNSTDKNDYYCWSVPAVNINTEAPGGFGSPPSY